MSNRPASRWRATYASSGSRYALIVNGTPYDLFFSADEERPVRLPKEGIGEKPFVYARGRVVLWSVRKAFCQLRDWYFKRETAKTERSAAAYTKTAA